MNLGIDHDLAETLINGAKRGNLELLREYVSELPNVRDTSVHKATVLWWSVFYGHSECVDFISRAHPHMMQMRDNYLNFTPLHISCSYGQLSVGSLLIERFPEMIRMNTNHGQTPLHNACLHGHSSLVSLLVEKDPESMNVTNKYGFTPLQEAAKCENLEVTRTLLSMNPSLTSHREALEAVRIHTSEPDSYVYTVISRFPVVEWQRQLGLQEEYMCVERALFLLESSLTLSHSLCVMVLRGEVLRQTQFVFQQSQQHGREIPPHSLEWHRRKWLTKFPL